MAGLEDMIRSSAPGDNIGKSLMLALLGLLASGHDLQIVHRRLRFRNFERA
jgi:hypothetical protein